MKKALPVPTRRPKRVVLSLTAAALVTVSFGAYAHAVAPAPPASKQAVFTNENAAVRGLLARMTLEEKVGQMMQVEQASLKDPNDIVAYHLGSLLSGGGSGPKRKEDYTREGWTRMIEGYQETALTDSLAIPLLYGIDAVHGNNNIPGATIYPHNIGLGATRDAALVRRISKATSEEVRAIGANWGFAPCVTVPQDIRWGRTYEGYSEDPALVKALGTAAVEGMQGKSLTDGDSLLACAKHFIGDGGTAFGTGKGLNGHGLDQGDTQVDEATLRRIHLQGYLGAIPAGVGSIMPSYSSWNGVKCSANKYLLTDLLKGELGFQGIAISDYNAIDQISPDFKKDVEISINAGMDMVMMTDQYRTFHQDLVALVNEGKVPMSRIDDAVTRILRVKAAMGLLKKSPNVMGSAKYTATFGGKAHRTLARQAVRESMVVLKNERATLPLSKKTARIVVAGVGADSLGMQCGGWTTSWQGQMDNPAVLGGTTLLAGIKGAVSKGTSVTYSVDGTGAQGATLGVVVVGERPYAEFEGDRDDLSLSQADRDAIANLKKANVPVVVIVLSGRPLVLGETLDAADAVVAAWLPGSEGGGVADVLFGDYRPTGKLPSPWPRSTTQLPLPLEASASVAQFPYGFGLTYRR